MKLKFLLQKNAWFIEHEQSWYVVGDEGHVRIAASALPLVVVDEHTLIAQPHLAGTAAIVEEMPSRGRALFRKARRPGGVRVTLTEPDGTPVIERRMDLDAGGLSSIEWLTHPFRDGWLDANASLVLDNVRRLELRAYLPERPESKGKSLLVHNETAGTSHEIWLERNRNNVVPLFDGGARGKVRLRLECEPEPTDAARDPRRLGFVLAGESVEAA